VGGRGSGGRRVGAGRKPTNKEELALRGSRRAGRGATKQTPGGIKTENQTGSPTPRAFVGQVSQVDGGSDPLLTPPLSLTVEQVPVWSDLAPLALREGTLNASTVAALRDLVELVVLRGKLLRAIEDQGFSERTETGLKSNPLLPQYRGLVLRVEAGMARFKLAPMGKEIGQGETAPADPFAEFSAPAADERAMTH